MLDSADAAAGFGEFVAPFCSTIWEANKAMPRWTEPAYIDVQRRRGTDPLLEVVDRPMKPGDNEYIVVCGVGGRTPFFRWYAGSAKEARVSFAEHIENHTWWKVTTDIYGNTVPNHHDFKPARIEWFAVAGDDDGFVAVR
jgi:hypothetical protein